jgi:branched-chain amino acid transport system permease protein
MSTLSPTTRRTITAAASVVAVLLFTEVALPGVGRHSARGAPMSILFSGLVLGSVNALTAAGLVLVYRSVRVVNFAQTAIGAAGAELCFEFVRYTRLPFPIAFLLGLALAGAAGFVFDIVIGRRFRDAPRLVPTVATIAAGGFLAGIGLQVDRLPFFPKVANRPALDAAGLVNLRSRLPFAHHTFTVGGLAVRYGFPEVFAIGVAVIGLGGLAWFLRSTSAGVATRALAENRDRAALLGISVTLLSAIVWSAAGVLSGAGVTLSGLLATPAAAVGFAPGLLLTALAAAIFGRMQSLPMTVLAAIEITVATRAASFALPNDAALIDVGLLLVIVAGLLLQRRESGRSEAGGVETWQMTDEQRPIPQEMSSLATVSSARRAIVIVALVALIALPLVTSTRIINLGALIFLSTLVSLLLVVLT